ncbi:MAG: efflux RND transporter periplasmic adaptor subunit, partial [Bauldia litoralis]
MAPANVSRSVAVVVLVSVAGLLAGCGDGAAPVASATPPPAVTVVPVTLQDFSRSQEFVGKTEAFHTVDIRAR